MARLLLSLIFLSLTTSLSPHPSIPTIRFPLSSLSMTSTTSSLSTASPEASFRPMPNPTLSKTTPDHSQSILRHHVYVQFDQLVWYDKIIKGRLTYGAVHDVSGIQAKKLFLWLPVTGIEVDKDAGMLEFYVGALY
ncbi:hypothetical protein HS088_TW04G00783 [Tripterygium wilfordii]|uniref:Uncharacterized protein n=1 Tax=Tripterygium wilfordii TaxID=458696 RepID=A0A7J7DRB7_TRIWF|nr:hypothetical protein HS088_TW04G00783 [Tripterygium wilfordii]